MYLVRIGFPPTYFSLYLKYLKSIELLFKNK